MYAQPIIQLKHFSRCYHRPEYKGKKIVNVIPQTLFKDFELTIHQGEFVAITGPSGTGKTTLQNTLGLLDPITSRGKKYPLNGKIYQSITSDGTLEWYGQKVSDFNHRQRARFINQNIGFIFQSFELINDLTVLENVALPKRISGANKKQAKTVAMQRLQQFDIADKAEYHPLILSGGEQQRTAIARALTNDAKVILADEPTGNLHADMKEQIIQTFLALQQKGITIVMVTHDEKKLYDDSNQLRVDRIVTLDTHHG